MAGFRCLSLLTRGTVVSVCEILYFLFYFSVRVLLSQIKMPGRLWRNDHRQGETLFSYRSTYLEQTEVCFVLNANRVSIFVCYCLYHEFCCVELCHFCLEFYISTSLAVSRLVI